MHKFYKARLLCSSMGEASVMLASAVDLRLQVKPKSREVEEATLLA
jgi:hypothetical protein